MVLLNNHITVLPTFLPRPAHRRAWASQLQSACSRTAIKIDARSSLPEQVKIVPKRRQPSGKPELSDIADALGLETPSIETSNCKGASRGSTGIPFVRAYIRPTNFFVV